MPEILDIKQRAEQLLNEKKFLEAQQLLAAVLTQHTDDGQLWRLSGLAQYGNGNFGSAASALEHAGMLVPLSAEQECMLADCYAKSKREHHARKLYQHLLENPDCPVEILATIAAGFGRLRDFRAALKVCRLASQKEPSRSEPRFGMVFYICRLGYPAKVAIPLMRQVVELSPDCSFYCSTLAFLLAADGNHQEAYDLLRDMPPAEAGCSCQLRRMMAIFEAVGDLGRWSACREQLHARQDRTRTSR